MRFYASREPCLDPFELQFFISLTCRLEQRKKEDRAIGYLLLFEMVYGNVDQLLSGLRAVGPRLSATLSIRVRQIAFVCWLSLIVLSQHRVASHYPWTSPAVDLPLGFLHGSSSVSGGYAPITDRHPCGGSLSLSAGVPSYINSPRYPEAYPPNTHCVWEVKAPFGTRITLYFEHLMMPTNRLADCSGDRIEVVDIHYTYRVCFYQYGVHYVTLAPSASVLFTSDRIREDFPARFRIRLEANRSGRCGRDITADHVDGLSGEVKTPNFPGSYPADALCAWRIRSPIGTRLAFRCDAATFWLEPSDDCAADFFAISASGDEAMKDATRYCGFNGPGLVTSESNVITMIFYSNSQRTFTGFRCHYGISDSSIDGLPSNTVSSISSPLPSVYFTSYPQTPSTAAMAASTSWLCNCGVENKKATREARIVGGTQTQINAYPWVVAIFKRDGRQYCAGSLINDRYILTASHCVARVRPSDIQVSLGDHDLDIREETHHQIAKVRRIVVHPSYRSTPVETDDIALLELAEPAQMVTHSRQIFSSSSSSAPAAVLTSTIRPICLPDVDTVDSYGQTPTVVGWGKLSEAGLSTSVLRETALLIQPNIECQKAYGYSVVTDNMICAAGQPEGATDACQGDSGGPMMVVHQFRWHIIGLVSYGFGCARPEYPGVYTRIDRYLDWIRENTQGAPTCPQTLTPSSPLPQPSSLTSNSIFHRYGWPWSFESTPFVPAIRSKR